MKIIKITLLLNMKAQVRILGLSFIHLKEILKDYLLLIIQIILI